MEILPEVVGFAVQATPRGKGFDYRSHVCTICGKKGHGEDRCYQRHGYPVWWKGTRNENQNTLQPERVSSSVFTPARVKPTAHVIGPITQATANQVMKPSSSSTPNDIEVTPGDSHGDSAAAADIPEEEKLGRGCRQKIPSVAFICVGPREQALTLLRFAADKRTSLIVTEMNKSIRRLNVCPRTPFIGRRDKLGGSTRLVVVFRFRASVSSSINVDVKVGVSSSMTASILHSKK
ncbi:predicted protein [Arabidopsis lyrata subsp. lyrata]|uniref:Predicted protein n=1 Tax=Arabidopsis lyrata subsp. lyrata TaxID=81972 RepID=D7M661_ARALL|nr:predicted protein [Arabidopsis lyrata subsp. lyrata]